MLRLLLLLSLFTALTWSYNPYCWFTNCDTAESKSISFSSKLNPYCYFTNCNENTASNTFLKPQCWFTDCTETSESHSSFWTQVSLPFEWNKKNAAGEGSLFASFNPFTWLIRKSVVEDHWYCRFIDCHNNQDEKTPFSMASVKDYASTLIPSKASMLNMVKNLNPNCWYGECCSQNDIPADVEKLRNLLLYNLFGQPFIEDIASAIEAHWSNTKANKALVLSLHGLPNTGKTYIIKLIAESLFKKGFNSGFVHYLLGDIHFQNKEQSQLYQNDLYHWIKGNVTSCPKQLFIFDNVQNIPVLNLFDEIIPLLTRNIVQGVDFTQVIFIFASNKEGDLIKDKFLELKRKDIAREKMTLPQFEKVIFENITGNRDKSIYYSFKDQNVIDHYIPFFPLESDHVIDYIVNEFRERGIERPLQEHIDEIMSYIEWVDHESYRFPKTDLLAVSSKISLYATKYTIEPKTKDHDNKAEQSCKSFWHRFNFLFKRAAQSEATDDTLWSTLNPLPWLYLDSSQEDKKSWYCWFRNCEDENEESPFSKASIKSYASVLIPSQKTMQSVVNHLNPNCWFGECCSKTNIPGDVQKLQGLLQSNLFGQPFSEEIASAIGAHWSDTRPNKPLVVSLHGLPSTGKTYIIQLIAKSLFKEGINSIFVHYFAGEAHFQDMELHQEYKDELYHWIKGNVTNCPKHLFIFDNMDKIPVLDLFDGIVPLLQREVVQGVDFTQAIFIFTSNREGELVKERFIELRDKNIAREMMALQQYERNISEKIYDTREKSTYHSFKDQNVIDHYIPLLPLESEHVHNYIIREFKDRGVEKPLQEHIDQIMSPFQWEDHQGYKFPKTDLRTLLSKISLYATKYYINRH